MLMGAVLGLLMLNVVSDRKGKRIAFFIGQIAGLLGASSKRECM